MITNLKNIKDTLINIKYNYNENDIIVQKRLREFLLEEKCDATFDSLVNSIIKYVTRNNLYDAENNTIKLDDKLKNLRSQLQQTQSSQYTPPLLQTQPKTKRKNKINFNPVTETQYVDSDKRIVNVNGLSKGGKKGKTKKRKIKQMKK